MPKIMEIIEKETKGKSYHTYKYSYDSIGLPSIDYDDDPNKFDTTGGWVKVPSGELNDIMLDTFEDRLKPD